MLSFCVGCAARMPVVLTESEQVRIVKPGEVFRNDTELVWVVISQGSYVTLVEWAADRLP